MALASVPGLCVLRVAIAPPSSSPWQWLRVACPWRDALALTSSLRALPVAVLVCALPPASSLAAAAPSAASSPAAVARGEEAELLVCVRAAHVDLVEEALLSARVLERGTTPELAALSAPLLRAVTRAIEEHVHATLIHAAAYEHTLRVHVHALLARDEVLLTCAVVPCARAPRVASLNDALSRMSLCTWTGLGVHVESVLRLSALPRSQREALVTSWRALGVVLAADTAADAVLVARVRVQHSALRGRAFLYPLCALRQRRARTRVRKRTRAGAAAEGDDEETTLHTPKSTAASAHSESDAMLWSDAPTRSPAAPALAAPPEEHTPSPRAALLNDFLDLPAAPFPPFHTPTSSVPGVGVSVGGAGGGKRVRAGVRRGDVEEEDEDEEEEEEDEDAVTRALKRARTGDALLPANAATGPAFMSVLDAMGDDLDDSWITDMDAGTDAAPPVPVSVAMSVATTAAATLPLPGDAGTVRDEGGDEGEEERHTPVPGQLFGAASEEDDGDDDARARSAPLPDAAVTPLSAPALLADTSPAPGSVPSVPPFTLLTVPLTSLAADTPLTPMGYSPLSAEHWTALVPADYAALSPSPLAARPSAAPRYEPTPTPTHTPAPLSSALALGSVQTDHAPRTRSQPSDALMSMELDAHHVQPPSAHSTVTTLLNGNGAAHARTPAHAITLAAATLSEEDSAALELLMRTAASHARPRVAAHEHAHAQWSALSAEERRVALETLALAAQTALESRHSQVHVHYDLDPADADEEDTDDQDALEATDDEEEDLDEDAEEESELEAEAVARATQQLARVLTAPSADDADAAVWTRAHRAALSAMVSMLHATLHSATLHALPSLPHVHACALAPTRVVVGHAGQWLHVAPSALRAWTQLRLEPYAPRKHERTVHQDRALNTALSTLFKNLDALYTLAGLGKHERVEVPSAPGAGSVRSGASVDEVWSAYLDDCASAKDTLNALLAPFAADHCVVVYLVHARSYAAHCEAVRALLVSLSAAQRARVTVQRVPSAWLGRAAHKEAHSATLLSLALDTYTKARRLTMATQWSALRAKSGALDEPRLFEPLLALPLGSEEEDALVLHCCYAWSPDARWLSLACCDARAELLETRLLHVAGASVAASLAQLWMLLVKLVPQVRARPWRLVIARCDAYGTPMSVEEAQAWHELLEEKFSDEREFLAEFFAALALLDVHRVRALPAPPRRARAYSRVPAHVLLVRDAAVTEPLARSAAERPLQSALLLPHALRLDLRETRTLLATVDTDADSTLTHAATHYARLHTLALAADRHESGVSPWPLPHAAALRLCALASASEY